MVNIFKRMWRILTFKKGVYGRVGKHNHFSKGVVIYENADVGNYCYFSPYSLINNASLGNYCSIGPGCMIGLGEHNYRLVSTSTIIGSGSNGRPSQIFDPAHKTVIGEDVWIGANVFIKQGVSVGLGAVIGAGSVVLKDIPPFAIAVGNPARIIKYRFSKDVMDKIVASKWFLEDKKKALEIVKEIGMNKDE